MGGFMSSIVLSGDTSGTITLDAPAVAGTNTILFPANTGTVITTASSGQSIPKAALPTGSVLQVVQGSLTTFSTTTSTSFVDTGLSATITPTSNTSKILVMYSATVATANSNGGHLNKILRGSTEIWASGVVYTNSSNYLSVSTSGQYLDSPATTSSTTYKVQFATQNAASEASFNINFGGFTGEVSTITLLEIAA